MELKYEISGCSSFQQNTVKDICEKFYGNGDETDKKKVLLADEMGMGKTYVCRGIIENIPKVGVKNIIYIAPNLIVAKQNHKALCEDFECVKNNVNTRISALNNFEIDLKDELNESDSNDAPKVKCCIRSLSAGMFFETCESGMGTKEERQNICQYLRAFFKEAKNCEEHRKWADENEVYVDMIISAFFYGRYDDYKIDKKKLAKDENMKIIKQKYREWVAAITEEKFEIPAEEIVEVKKYLEDWEIYSKDSKDSKVSEIKKLCEIVEEEDFQTIVENQYDFEKSMDDTIFQSSGFKENSPNEGLYLAIPYWKDCNKAGSHHSRENYENAAKKSFHNLRVLLNFLAMRRIKPDLIILDEFHKYFNEDIENRLEEYREDASAANMKVLFMSATPYKMINTILKKLEGNNELGDEDSKVSEKKEDTDTVFKGYVDLYKYISGKDCTSLGNNLEAIKENLKKLEKVTTEKEFDKIWKDSKKQKAEAEKLLKEYVVRTERHRLETEKKSDYEQIIISSDKESEELKYLEYFKYIKYEAEQTKHLCNIENYDNFGINLNYSKMTPYALSFSEGYRCWSDSKDGKLTNKFINTIDKSLLWDGEEEPGHFRYQALKNFALENEDILKALWIPASNIRKEDLGGFWKNVNGHTKTLVFARYRMSTKSIAALLSARVNKLGGEDIADIFEGEKVEYITESFNIAFGEEEGEKLSNIFYEYLKSNQNILAYAGVKSKADLEKYCRDGCLLETLKEYYFVLKKSASPKKEKTTKISLLFDMVKNALNVDLCEVNYYSRKLKDKVLKDNEDNANQEKVKCAFAKRFSSEDNAERIQDQFNSPFYPFVLATTAIAQEGVNFQNYCHRIFHWKTPISPIDFEQREGRINRYRNHAVRKSLANEKASKTDWGEIFDLPEENNGLSPNWIANVENPIKIQSYIINQPNSKDFLIEQMLKYSIQSYRVSLGYGIDQEVMYNIIDNAKKIKQKGIDFADILLNLSPENSNC